MAMIILTILSALAISAVAIYYSVAGLAAIFAASVVPVVIMGTVLEVGKLVTAVWLHRNWQHTVWWLKTYLTVAVMVLMFITSMGIFGFLSKAHIDQSITSGDNGLQIELVNKKIAREQSRMTDAQTVIAQLDKAVQTLIDYDRIRGKDGAIATREKQKEERAQLNGIIDEASAKVAALLEQRLILDKGQIKLEAEVGPIKYIAEFVYGNSDRTVLEKAVQWVIVIIISVFDPLAVLLLIASQHSLKQRAKSVKPESTIAKTLDDTEIQIESIESAVKFIERELQECPSDGPESESDSNQYDENIRKIQDREEAETEAAVQTAKKAVAPAAQSEEPEPKKKIVNHKIREKVEKDSYAFKSAGRGYIEIKGKVHRIKALAESNPELHLDFASRVLHGSAFPDNPNIGELFIRTDFVPTRVGRFNGHTWDIIDKHLLEPGAYTVEYVKYLIDEIANGDYNESDLNQVETELVIEYLKTL